MTALDFHSDVSQPLQYAARLVRKATQLKQPLVLLCESTQMDALEEAIASLDKTTLVPLGRQDSAAAVIDRSLVLVAQSAHAVPARGWLVNLTQSWPEGFEAFEKVIEVIATDEAAVQAGRQRWAQYKAKGYPLAHRKTPANA
ncbi:MAG: hypothetical protein RL357_1768 [Pseudomonadota bacterium]